MGLILVTVFQLEITLVFEYMGPLFESIWAFCTYCFSQFCTFRLFCSQNSAKTVLFQYHTAETCISLSLVCWLWHPLFFTIDGTPNLKIYLLKGITRLLLAAELEEQRRQKYYPNISKELPY